MQLAKLTRSGAEITQFTNPVLIITNVILTIIECYAPSPVVVTALGSHNVTNSPVDCLNIANRLDSSL
jgi:uncharacterized membrane protein YraQ (UPF0718 family)